jgi:hypothetical protein
MKPGPSRRPCFRELPFHAPVRKSSKMCHMGDAPCLATGYGWIVTYSGAGLHALACTTEQRSNAHHIRSLTTRRGSPHRKQTSVLT